jgi:anti-anti-sigma factor
MEGAFTIREASGEGVARLAIGGDVDLGVLKTIREAVNRLLTDGTISSLVMDLEDVTFIDSSGLGMLVASKRQAIDLAKDFRVTGATGQAAEVIEATGLTAYLLGG